jgi:glycoprotein endo-alpha-1,2-mannosidase
MILNGSKRKPRGCLELFSAVVFLCSSLTGFAETSSFFQFVQDQSQRQYTKVPHEVLAVYYGWYGNVKQTPRGTMDVSWEEANTNRHEIRKTARYPVKGTYSSHDVDVLDWQIDQAKAHGITGFVVSWFGTGPEAAWINESVALLFERAEKKDFKVAIYLEQAPGEGRDQIGRAIGELSYVINRYGKNKSFLKVDGRPVFFAYGRDIYQVPVAAWPEIIEGVRAKAGDFALLADGHQASYTYLFDGIHSYDLAGLPLELARELQVDKLGDLHAWAAKYYGDGVRLARERSRISCLMVTPGCDSRKAYKFDWETDRLDGQTYRALWEEAIKASPDWVMITSWNEWPEGTEIEPSLELGDKYLQITAEYSKRFLASAAVKAPIPLGLPQFAPGTAQPLDKVLSGRNVAVLMQDQKNDTEFWAAYCGATLQRVTWADLIDPKIFNAGNFPLFLHIGTEHYSTSVKTTDDVMRALIRYLREGGFLVSVPVGTWPLLYDDSRKGVPLGITDRLGMAVDNGFDQPPGGVELSFRAKTNVLFGLRDTVPFPKTGDLRFRPATRKRALATDIYVPLVQVSDSSGKAHGDAVAYIEHRVPSISSGKTLYVWMRTGEAFSQEIFLPSLYQFVSTRLRPLPSENP